MEKINCNDNLMDELDNILEKYDLNDLCKLSDDDMYEYNKLYDDFIYSNSNPECSTKRKGESLEKIATFLLKKSGIFDVYQNVITSSNEIDQLIRCNKKGKILTSVDFIDKRFNHFICECKNYSKAIPVTYVGKAMSLLSFSDNKICIMFSYYGISGSGWNCGTGAVKKFYLSKERSDDRFCILDFNKKDFDNVKDGTSFIKILTDKIFALKNDVDYEKYVRVHEKQEEIRDLQQV